MRTIRYLSGFSLWLLLATAGFAGVPKEKPYTGCTIYRAMKSGMTIAAVKQSVRAHYAARPFKQHPFRISALYQWTLSNDTLVQVEFNASGKVVTADVMSAKGLQPNEEVFITLLRQQQLTLLKARALLGAGKLTRDTFYYTFPDGVNFWGHTDENGRLVYVAINAGCDGGTTNYKKL